MASKTGISPSELGVQILQNCRNELCSLFPQLDTALAALPYAPNASGSIGTDGAVLGFSPLYVVRAYLDSPAAVRRGYLHMLLHCLYLHPFATPSRTWDLACDMAVEKVIEDIGAPRLALPANETRRECLRRMGSGAISAEKVRGMLEQGVFPFSMGELEAAFRFDSHAPWRTGAENASEGRKKWAALGVGAARGGSSAGTAAGRRSERVSLPKAMGCDYREFLRRFVSEREEVVLDPESFDLILYSYGLEQYGNLPLLEPLEYQEAARLEEMVIAIDTSGSCSAETVGRFLAETWAIVSRRENFFREMKVYLIQCDCLVQKVDVIRSPEDWQQFSQGIAIHGRGGTDFTPVFRYVEGLRHKGELKNLRLLLYFTDGDGVYPREKTDYETAFVFLSRRDRVGLAPAWAVKLVLDAMPEGRAIG